MRDKLIELLASKVCEDYSPTCDEWEPHSCEKCYANNCEIGKLADHLLANGVIVPPCKVGDTIHTISSGLVKEHKIEKIEITRSKIYLFFNWRGMGYEIADSDLIGKTVFLSREEAEKALKGSETK